MLILTRRIGETLVIGEDVFLTVLGVKGNQVRLGINAPHEVIVHREEIFVKVKAQQAALNARENALDTSLAQALRAHRQSTSTRQLTH